MVNEGARLGAAATDFHSLLHFMRVSPFIHHSPFTIYHLQLRFRRIRRMLYAPQTNQYVKTRAKRY